MLEWEGRQRERLTQILWTLTGVRLLKQCLE
jgi:hypothetical protein